MNKQNRSKEALEKDNKNEIAIAKLVAATVAMEFGVSSTQVFKKHKGPNYLSFTRQAAMYLMHVVFGFNISRVARAFGRDRSTACHACHVIEDCREDPLFDKKLNRLEVFLKAAPMPASTKEAA